VGNGAYIPLQLRRKLFLYIELRPISLLFLYRKSATNSTDEKISKITAHQLRKFNKFVFVAWMRFPWFNLSPATSTPGVSGKHWELNYKNSKITAP
jgi:hypothetical protein